MPDQPPASDPQITTTHQNQVIPLAIEYHQPSVGLLTLIILSSMILGASIAALVLS